MQLNPESLRQSKEYVQVYAVLATLARWRGYITYGGLGALLGIPPGDYQRNVLGHLCGAISEDEVAKGRPMLSALVVLKDRGVPRGEFFAFARGLGRYKGRSDLAFWKKERDEVFRTWQA